MDNYNYTSSSKVVLRSESKSILSAKVSIPRVNLSQCDKCGYRLSRASKYEDAQKRYTGRPHSVHVVQDSYLYLQHMEEVHMETNVFLLYN